ncbi:hypothetical protein [Ferrimonas lipolytica]|uniref:Uncharacterized protein n=1 Tax=Ferrimonas lipolytica TaxID=2724191 RepID=A0A6H1UC38_9GAMM|nr:hypothetical protein [Ferrimonas lipolytica]QIZ76604.1 hypothetical protein HER31_06825 [Ferrimonas lipolytica]
MSMKSAKEFAVWMIDRFGNQAEGVYLDRADIRELSGRQTIRQDFIADVHAEVCRHGMGFVTNNLKERYFLFYLPKHHWKEVADRYAPQPSSNIHSLEKQKLSRSGR